MGKKKKKKKRSKWRRFATSKEIDEVCLEIFGAYYYCLGEKKNKDSKVSSDE